MIAAAVRTLCAIDCNASLILIHDVDTQKKGKVAILLMIITAVDLGDIQSSLTRILATIRDDSRFNEFGRLARCPQLN